jgi:hypothetical protein
MRNAANRAKTTLLASLLLASAVSAQEPKAPSTQDPKAPAAEATKPSTASSEVPAQESTSAAPASNAPDVSSLQSELSSVLDELIQARTRAAVLAKSLFKTRIELLMSRRADDQKIVHVRLGLDGVPVHDSDGSAVSGSDQARMFQGYVAPGVHEISVEITEQAKDNPTYRYTRSERFRIETKKNTSTQVELYLHDDSDMAEELPEGDDGKYEVSTRVRVTPVKVGD